jgi:hypothetical protein
MNVSRQRWWAGLLGLAGAILLALGDQGLYFAPVSGSDFVAHLRDIVAAAPTDRILLGATVGPLAVLLYLFGFWHVYMNIRERQPSVAGAVAVGLVLSYLAGGSYHVFWAAKALAIQAAVHADAPYRPALALLDQQIHDFGARLYQFAELPGYLAGLLLLMLIAFGRTAYPRWVALVTPAVPVLLLQMVEAYIPAPLGSLLVGSAVNLSFAAFFAISLATTTPRGADAITSRP